METLEPSRVTKESTVRLLKEEIPRRPSSKPDTTTLEAQNQQISSQIRQLKKNQTYLQKLIKGKDVFMSAKNRQLCSLNKQLEEKERENNIWKKIMRKLCHSSTENITLETEEDQKSAELRKLKKQQHALEKVMKAKGLVVKAKTHQVHTLEDTLLKKEEENSILKQSMRKLEEAVSTLLMDIAKLQQEQEKSHETAQEKKKAFEDTKTKMPSSFPEKEGAACELGKELHTGAQLLQQKEDTSQQLLSATESMLKKSPEFNQEREEMLLAMQQDHLKAVALQSATSQEELSQEPKRDHEHLAQSHESHVPEALQEEDGLVAIQSGVGADSSSLRALSSVPSAAGPVIESPCGEAQMPLPTLATCTASLSGQAEAKVESKQLPADPSPSTTGHKKLLATKVLGTVVWFNVKARYGFIRRHDIQQDIFVHHTAIKSYTGRYYLPSLADGEIVEFDVEEGQKGVQAANVTGPSGAAVRGSRYVAQWCHSRCLAQCRAPQRQTMQSHIEISGSMYDNQAHPRWPQRCPRLLPCYQPRLCWQDSNKPLLGERMEVAHGPAAENHQVHSQDQGENIQGQQPPLWCSPCSRPHSLRH
ncbi:thyroid receptor-interacting protein 11-like [Ochotona princeps]|uniref:thyroid receptor-interacting protein 11-like n=1 Tax=Ochotona princeps TaxID=9978 RepID=UPI0027148F78|nr:thyroid receptor-interacting protein 11-like [Ochotona princeps]